MKKETKSDLLVLTFIFMVACFVGLISWTISIQNQTNRLELRVDSLICCNIEMAKQLHNVAKLQLQSAEMCRWQPLVNMRLNDKQKECDSVVMDMSVEK